ncbi:hypothetical protein D3C71_1843530 [compost metagenome]
MVIMMGKSFPFRVITIKAIFSQNPQDSFGIEVKLTDVITFQATMYFLKRR